MTQKQKENTLLKTFQKISTEFKAWNLFIFKNNIIDRFKSYFVDLDIQRNPYFTYQDAIAYIQSYLVGASLNSFIMARPQEIIGSYEQNGVGTHTKTFKYFKNLVDKAIEFLSVDGNNRVTGWYWFFNDIIKLPKGTILPLYQKEDNTEYHIELPKSMNYSEICQEYGEQWEDWMQNSNKLVMYFIDDCTKPQLHLIFRCVNQVKKLNRQEDRNCIDVEIAQIIRENANLTNKESFGKFFEEQFDEVKRNERAHESFLAYVYTLCQDFGNYFPTLFGEKPVSQIKETQITKRYEEDSITSETISKTNKAIKRLKQFIEFTNSGKFISDNIQLSRALTAFFYKINNNYTNVNWEDLFDFVWKEHQSRLNDDTQYKFNHISKKRNYSDMVTSGVSYLSITYQFFSSKLLLLELNGIITPKQARDNFTYDIKLKLYNKQNGVCNLSGNEIVDFNDTSKYHIDHIIPISKWLTDLNGQDPNEISNLKLVEKKENLKKSNKRS